MNKEDYLGYLQTAWGRLMAIKPAIEKIQDSKITDARLLTLHYGEGRKVTCSVLYNFNDRRFSYFVTSPSLTQGVKFTSYEEVGLDKISEALDKFSTDLSKTFPFVEEWEENPVIEVDILGGNDEEEE